MTSTTSVKHNGNRSLRSLLRPRLRTVLISLNLIVLLLPLAGIQVLRLYESALVRQTESELIAQGAFIAAAYRNAFDRVLAFEPPEQAGRPGAELERHSLAPLRTSVDTHWRHRPAVLDLADSTILPPQPAPRPLPPTKKPDSLAYIVGQDLETILKDAQRVTLASIRITDFQGIVVATTGEERYLDLTNTEEVAAALQGIHSARLRRKEDQSEPKALDSISRTTRIRAFVATPIVLRDRVLGVVLLSRTPANIVQALYAKRTLLAQAVGLMILVVVLIAFVASRTIVGPLRKLTQLARASSLGDSSAIHEIGPRGTAEIAELGEALAQMGQNLEYRRRYVQEFARHVSHEFKTPLAALSGAIEIMEDHAQSMTATERNSFLANMNDDVAHLNRLTEQLLELARADMIDSANAAASASRVDLDELLVELVATYEDALIPVTYLTSRVFEARPIAQADADAVRAALTQLIENAVVHGKTTRRIDLHLQRSKGRWLIDVKDDGQGISAGNRGKILQPFFTTARDNGSTGLGLAIAQRLLANQGGSLALVDAPQKTEDASPGCCFQVSLPVLQTTLQTAL